MNRSLFFFSFILLFFVTITCQKPSDEISNLNIFLETNSSERAIDEVFAVTVTSEDSLDYVGYKAEGDSIFRKGFFSNSIGKSKPFFFSYYALGRKQICIEARNLQGAIDSTSIYIDIVEGNSLKIKEIKLISFPNIDNTWDDEYPNSNPNHLADVFFQLKRSTVSEFSNDNDSTKTIKWVQSSIKENQGDLTWNFSSEELYVGYQPNYSVIFQPYLIIQFFDKDDETSTQLAYAFGFNFDEYETTKPEIMIFHDYDEGIEFLVKVDWQ